MEKRFVDLHIHTTSSDGSYSVEEVFEKAVHNNVSIIAITDHNSVGAIAKALELVKKYSISYWVGVEIDSLYKEKRCHILGYHYDVEDKEFLEFIDANKRKLEEADWRTLNNLSMEYNIDMFDYSKYENDARKGGWKIINYMVDRGIARNQDEAIKIMKKYKNSAEFPLVSEVINKIHRAGGIAILAHPGVTFKNNDFDKDIDIFEQYLDELCEFGIDGIECYYPSHKSELQNYLDVYCRKHNLLITSGSDFHGEFFRYAKQNIGSEFKTETELVLKK